MTISGSQSRAARALLNKMTCKEAAKLSGIGEFSIMRFENGETKPSAQKIQNLKNFYIKAGIDFLDYDGVRRKPDGIFIELTGSEGFKEFIYDVHETMKNSGGEVCVSNVDEKQFEKWQGAHSKDYLEKMASIKNLSFKILVEEGDTYFTASKYAEYRHLSSEYFSSVPAYIYGNKKAEIIFSDNDVSIIIINNEKSAEAHRKYFALLWEKSNAI